MKKKKSPLKKCYRNGDRVFLYKFYTAVHKNIALLCKVRGKPVRELVSCICAAEFMFDNFRIIRGIHKC